MTSIQQKPPTYTDLLAELRAIRIEQTALRRLLDEAIGVFLNARFPYGQPTDRWRRSA